MRLPALTLGTAHAAAKIIDHVSGTNDFLYQELGLWLGLDTLKHTETI